MRLEIDLRNTSERAIPVNYQYYLTSAIYRYMGIADYETTEAIHDYGFGKDKNGIKFFTYSYLKGKNLVQKRNNIIVFPGIFKWYVSSPLNKLLDMIIEGINNEQSLKIKDERFSVETIKLKGCPKLHKEERFVLNSPLVVCKYHKSGRIEYKTIIDGEFNEIINHNLKRKYEMLFGEKYSGQGVAVSTEKKFPNTKLIKYKDVRIKGLFDYIDIIGDTDLMHIAYDAGLGEKNSMGFGMIERRKNA